MTTNAAKPLALFVAALLSAGLLALLWAAGSDESSRDGAKRAPQPAGKRVEAEADSSVAEEPTSGKPSSPASESASVAAPDSATAPNASGAVSVGGLEVRGRVVSASDQPLAGIEVEVRVSARIWSWSKGLKGRHTETEAALDKLARQWRNGSRDRTICVARAVTAVDGRYRVQLSPKLRQRLAESTTALVAVAGDRDDPHVLGRSETRLHKQRVLGMPRIRLTRSRTLQVQVRTSLGPLVDAVVRLSGRSEYGWRKEVLERRTSPEGLAEFAFHSLRSDDLRVRVEAPGYAHWQQALPERGLAHRLTAELVAEAHVSGVALAGGEPKPGLHVGLQPSKEAQARGLAAVYGSTDERGAFELAGVAPGAGYELTCWDRSGTFLGHKQPLTPPAEDLRIALELGGALGLTLQPTAPGDDFEELEFAVERLGEGGEWLPQFSFSNRIDHERFTTADVERPELVSGERYVEYRWIVPGEYRVRGVGGSLEDEPRLVVRAGETARAKLRAVAPRTVRVKLPNLEWGVIDVTYPLGGQPYRTSMTLDEGVLTLHAPPLAREVVLQSWDSKPLRVALPAGVSEIGPLELEPLPEEDD